MKRSNHLVISLALGLGLAILLLLGVNWQSDAAPPTAADRSFVAGPQYTGRNTAPQAVAVSVRTPAAPLQVGQFFTVAVDAAQVDTPLGAFQLDLSYDPVIVAYVSRSPGDLLASTGRTVVCPPAAQPDAGSVRLACASTGPFPGATGAGALAVLTFRATGVGHSPLTLSNLQLPDDNSPPGLIGATTQDGSVEVGIVAAVALDDSQTQVGAPGTEVTHVLTLTNQGNYTDTFSLAVNGNEWPSLPTTDSVGPLGAGASASVLVTVQIPPAPLAPEQTIVASDTFTLTATSARDDQVRDDARGTTLAGVEVAVALSGDQSRSGAPGTDVTYVFTLTNQGSYSDAFAFGLALGGHTWPVTLSTSSLGPLAAGSSAPFSLTVHIPAQAKDGQQDSVVITATSGLDAGVSAQGRATTIAQEGVRRIYLPLILKTHPASGEGRRDGGDLPWLAGLGFPMALSLLGVGYRPGRKRRRFRPGVPWRHIFSCLVVLSILGSSLPITPVQAAPTHATRNTQYAAPLTPTNSFWADLDGDHDVDGHDLSLMAEHWNCATGQPCYDALYDRDGDGDIDALDLAHLGNQYDVEPPGVVITSPPEGTVVGGATLNVSGAVSDTHAASADGSSMRTSGTGVQSCSPFEAGPRCPKPPVRAYALFVKVRRTSSKRSLPVRRT